MGAKKAVRYSTKAVSSPIDRCPSSTILPPMASTTTCPTLPIRSVAGP